MSISSRSLTLVVSNIWYLFNDTFFLSVKHIWCFLLMGEIQIKWAKTLLIYSKKYFSLVRNSMPLGFDIKNILTGNSNRHLPLIHAYLYGLSQSYLEYWLYQTGLNNSPSKLTGIKKFKLSSYFLLFKIFFRVFKVSTMNFLCNLILKLPK